MVVSRAEEQSLSQLKFKTGKSTERAGNLSNKAIYIIYNIIILAEVPGFVRGIPRTIKYKCAIIAHHERKAGEMPISSVFMTKDAHFSHGSINKTVGIPLISGQLSSVVSNKELVVATTCTPEHVSGPDSS